MFPNAQTRDRVEFYRETTEGFLNKYVRDQMFCYEPTDVESFGARAVNVVQIERHWIRIRDSDTKRLDGLVPVTRPTKRRVGLRASQPPTKGPANTGEWERADSDSEEEGASQVGCQGRGTVKGRGGRPWEGPGGAAAIAAARLPQVSQGGEGLAETTGLTSGATPGV